MQSSQAGRREEGEKVWECVCAGGQHHLPCLLNIRAIGVTLVRWGRDLCLSPAECLTPSTHLPTHLPSIHPSIHPYIYLLILHAFTFCPCIHTPTHLSSIHLLTYVFSLALLIPQPGVKPMPPAVEAWSPNHWTAREVPPPTCLLFIHPPIPLSTHPRILSIYCLSIHPTTHLSLAALVKCPHSL